MNRALTVAFWTKLSSQMWERTRSMRMTALIAVVFVFACAAARAGSERGAAISTAIDVRPEDLLAQPPAANWISYNGDYSGRRFSSLTEIDTSNIAQLRAQWVDRKSVV